MMTAHANPLESTLSDRIVLTIPTDERFRSVATLVLGGLGSRLDLPYERTDDLQLAVLSALASAGGEAATIEVEATEETVRVSIGPLADEDGVDGLNRVLARLVDEVAHVEREGAAWVVLSLGAAAAP